MQGRRGDGYDAEVVGRSWWGTRSLAKAAYNFSLVVRLQARESLIGSDHEECMNDLDPESSICSSSLSGAGCSSGHPS